MVWEQEVIPDDWNQCIICPVFKKGDPTDCSNYRGISLLNGAYKVFSNILYSRLLPYAEANIGEYQSGFRIGKSTVDAIFTMRQILEKTFEYNVDTYYIFIDFKAAYDSVQKAGLFTALNYFRVPAKLIRMISATIINATCSVKVMGQTSSSFQPEQGLKQGDALSCLLFNMVLEYAVRKANVQTTGTIFNKSTQLIAYADDIAIVSRSLPAAEESFTAIEKEALAMGLIINRSKTKAMVVSGRQETRSRVGQYLNIGNENIEVVDSFNYLGSTITNGDDTSAEISKRIMLANRALFKNAKAMSSKILSWTSKVIIYKTLIRSVLCYGCETWRLSKSDENRLAVFERRVLRRIFGGVCEDGVWRRRYNFELNQLYNNTPIVVFIKSRRLEWAGLVARMPQESTVKRVLSAAPTGIRRKGRPRLRWRDNVDQDAYELGVHDWKAAAVNRDYWRRTVEEARTRSGL